MKGAPPFTERSVRLGGGVSGVIGARPMQSSSSEVLARPSTYLGLLKAARERSKLMK